ncbi:unnamed protein product [Cladocopium goreaui]|uniref:Uncharacterized protein n=1 Tax=Cladocopium goreaui TaxID=2562237 RepID=A0A9P1G3Z3_9DINO|nr:unnamed protein product [Cladocopium goreaui]
MALKRPCCKSRCKHNLTLKTVMTLVVTFWSLSKNSQDSLLWSLQNSSLMMDEGEPEDDGIQVCRQAWLQILGIGKERILRCKRNFKGTDGRSLGHHSHSAPAAASVLSFLRKTYWGIAVYSQMKTRAKQQRDILVCIIDSMDKSKFRLPRFAAGRTPKPLETKKRPELEFTACIMHGLPQHLLADVGNRIPPRFGGDSPNDVFLMVKGFISDVTLSQQILAVWPGNAIDETTNALRRCVAAYLDDDRKEAMQKIFDMECVAKHIPIQSPAMNVPMTSSNGLILDLWMLSFAESAKYGLMGRWPANHQVRAHFPSFLNRGYEAHRESLEIKFDMTTVEADRSVYTIKPFTGITEDALSEDEGMAKTIATFRYIKCNFTKHAKAEDFLYETLCQALGLANRTAEKTKPSALDMMLLFKETVRIKQSAPQARKSALRDVLYGCIADYNKTGWRVTDSMRRLIYNLLRCPSGLWEALKICYSESKPEHAAMTMENMEGDYFVPGTELLENVPKIWKDIQEILTSFGSGIRRPDSERIMLWVNYVAAGVVPGKKILFTVEQVQQFLHAFPRTSVAFVLLPNRAQDLRKEEKDEADEDREEDDQGAVRPVSVFFEPTTVYGTREGYHSALMITSKDKGNCFLKSALYKSGVVSSVSMLPRSGSLKLPGFPCFESVVQDLKNSANEVAMPDFQVCVAVPNGLAIKQNLVDYWSGIDTFQLQVADLVEAHNKKYNPHGIKRGASDAAPSGGSSDWDMSPSLLQRCELASSSDERASEEKKLGKEPKDESDEPKIKKPRGKTPKNETNDDEDPPKTLKRPAAKKFKKDEFDGMFDDFQRGDGDDHSDPDADEGEGGGDKKKAKDARRMMEMESNTRRSRSATICQYLMCFMYVKKAQWTFCSFSSCAFYSWNACCCVPLLVHVSLELLVICVSRIRPRRNPARRSTVVESASMVIQRMLLLSQMMMRLAQRPLRMTRVAQRALRMRRLAQRASRMRRLAQRASRMRRLAQRALRMRRLARRALRMRRLARRVLRVTRVAQRASRMRRLAQRALRVRRVAQRASMMRRLAQRALRVRRVAQRASMMRRLAQSALRMRRVARGFSVPTALWTQQCQKLAVQQLICSTWSQLFYL